jgi:hypothetical protein
MAMKPGQQFINPSDLVAQGGDARFYKAAVKDKNRRKSLSVIFEELDPSSRYPRDSDDYKIGAFGRAMRAAGIKTASDTALGYFADPIESFFDSSEKRALFPEWCRRQWVKARTGRSLNNTGNLVIPSTNLTQRLITSADEAVGTAMRPIIDNAEVRQRQLTADISVADIVSVDTAVDGNTYRTIYIDEATPGDIRFVRVTEHAEIPMALVSTSEQEIGLFKYARGIEVSDEARRRGRIDKLGLFLAQVAVQQEADKVAQAMHVLINGDGNANTSATEYDLTTLDPAATAGTLSLKGWVRYKMQFNRGFSLDTVIGRESDIIQLLLLNTGSANQPITAAFGGAFGELIPINRRLQDGVRFAISDEAPSGKLVGFDSAQALERATEVGSNIQETTRFVTRLSDALVMAEVEGYGIIDQRATKVLDVAS